jgi:hypothetical protein
VGASAVLVVAALLAAAAVVVGAEDELPADEPELLPHACKLSSRQAATTPAAVLGPLRPLRVLMFLLELVGRAKAAREDRCTNALVMGLAVPLHRSGCRARGHFARRAAE